MNKSEIEVYTVAEVEIDECWKIQARWYGGSGVNVYVDGKEVDYFTNYNIKTPDDLAEALADYIHYEESLIAEL